ncbi:hypothetical protein COL154_006024 [Colletotrichum chrysophilum]|uniref:Ribosome biogenesis protein NSA2 n=1 Tax=Colletotrichum chrysophilum TaxID=1836956 RepID=A0AAD9AIY9_9PEZI|nr:hypothetical protein KNSL1_012885 [Colletotrichum chrysophilum]KAJ0362843.1 hypothetical protein COL154_006024 [Colletotrichum chrysophilum]KAK1848966.1 Ribosome biogenesis protein NSA2 [Colletotrichum chrysophilum]
MLNVHLHHRLDIEERERKRLARTGHKQSYDAQELRGIRAKMMQENSRHEKIQMRKPFKGLEEQNIKTADDSLPPDPVPHYLLDQDDPKCRKNPVIINQAEA